MTELKAWARGVFTNRTLNMRAIRAVGFDMDYTLIQYRTEEFERRAFEQVRERLVARGWPLDGLSYDPGFVTLGLVVDTELGNLVKANRFGYVTRACHGTRMLDFDAQRELYGRVLVDLREPRWSFMNTLFSLSGASLYAHAVDLLDGHRIDEALGYGDLYRIIRSSLDEEHLFGQLKLEIRAAPARFVEPEPDLALALLDLRNAGKKLLLVTNSAWDHTEAMMTHGLDPFLRGGTSWRDLFDLVIVSARKPGFFGTESPAYEVVEGGLLRPHYAGLETGKVYQGGHAGLVEAALGLSGSEILYVGDHIFADVMASKSVLRWRTALVVRELEQELAALEGFGQGQRALSGLMETKGELEHRQAMLRLGLQRLEGGYGPRPGAAAREIVAELQALKGRLAEIDERIAPLAKAASGLVNERWGLLMRAGGDKSLLARQIEQHADIYMSRVSNLLDATPFAYLRAPRGTLPHDPRP